MYIPSSRDISKAVAPLRPPNRQHSVQYNVNEYTNMFDGLDHPCYHCFHIDSVTESWIVDSTWRYGGRLYPIALGRLRSSWTYFHGRESNVRLVPNNQTKSCIHGLAHWYLSMSIDEKSLPSQADTLLDVLQERVSTIPEEVN